MKLKTYKILYWLSPLIGAALQIIAFICVMCFASGEENPADPKAYLLAYIIYGLLLVLLLIITYIYMLFARRFPKRFWVITTICLIAVSWLVMFFANGFFINEKHWQLKVIFFLGEILLFLPPVFVITYKYVSKRS